MIPPRKIYFSLLFFELLKKEGGILSNNALTLLDSRVQLIKIWNLKIKKTPSYKIRYCVAGMFFQIFFDQLGGLGHMSFYGFGSSS